MFGSVDLASIQLSVPLALALVATLGYLIGRKNRTSAAELAARSRRDLRRAQAAARELERIAWVVRRNLGKHHASLAKFKQRLSGLVQQEQDEAWKDLSRQAAEILTPTLRLANQIASAYDEIREQSHNLMAFTGSGSDPLTGITNRSGLDDFLAAQIALKDRYEVGFSVVLFDLDRFKEVGDEQGDLQGDRVLQHVAQLLNQLVRETDLVARYSGEQFVVVMPRTDLDGACALAERVRAAIQEQTPLTVSAGVAVALDGDSAESLLSRAEAAVGQATASGRNCVFWHDGEQIRPVAETQSLPPLPSAAS